MKKIFYHLPVITFAFVMIFGGYGRILAEIPQESPTDAVQNDQIAGKEMTENAGTENAGTEHAEAEYDMTSASVKVYYEGKYGSDEEERTMYFLNGNKQIAYYDMDTVCDIMEKLYQDGYGDYEKDPDYTLSCAVDGDIVTFTRENGYTMCLDFEQDLVTFFDFDSFISHSYDMTTVDLSHSSGFDEDGQAVYLERVMEQSYSRYGKELTFDLNAYNIDLIMQDGIGYIPAQTMADLLITTTYTLYLYNGESAFYVNYENFLNDSNEMTGMAEKYYSASAGNRSQELIDYTYNELCMVLDYSYGLKDTHNIDSFDDFFEELGYQDKSVKEMLNSEDPTEMEQGIYWLTSRGFDDLHSKYQWPSVYAGADCKEELYALGIGATRNNFSTSKMLYASERLNALADSDGNIPGYQEIGNTAFVTFDNFLPVSKDYYAEFPQSEADTADTVGLLIYAHSQITRDGSPIENVVMDLSCNTGGAEDAVAFVCAWFLGEANIYLADPLTDASSVNVYRCDANLDHVFDEQDTLEGLNLYCLTSPVSFSCGNLAPCMFACSNRVTLIGQTTGGGSCVVLPLTTASGSFFQVSGFRRISSMKNGSFYNADQGIEPDIVFTRTESFYDREALVDYINSLK